MRDAREQQRRKSGGGSDTAPRRPLQDILSAYPQPPQTSLPSEVIDLALGERTFQGKVALMGSGDAFLAAVAPVLGFPLPQSPNTVASNRGISALWLATNEWLVLTRPGSEEAVYASLRQALDGIHSLLVDVSDRWTTLMVAGAHAVSVLGKGTSVATGSPALAVGRCYQTRLFSTPVIIRPVDGRPSFDVLVDSTYAEYLWRWLNHAADGLNIHLFHPQS